MKTIKTFLITTFALAMAGLTVSCESISNPDPINAVDTTQTATIEGSAYANLDETNDTTGVTYESVPQGTTVKVVLDSRDFASNIEPGVDYKSLTYETTVNSTGDYSIEVPALGDPINADIYFDSFTAAQTQPDSTDEQREYSPQQFPYSVTIAAGMSSFNDVTYNAN